MKCLIPSLHYLDRHETHVSVHTPVNIPERLPKIESCTRTPSQQNPSKNAGIFVFLEFMSKQLNLRYNLYSSFCYLIYNYDSRVFNITAHISRCGFT